MMDQLFPGRTVGRPGMPFVSRREQTLLWLIFAGSILGSAYVHELGHCIPAWLHGYPAIPTPAKEYISAAVADSVQRAISLGGILGSVLALLGALCLYLKSRAARASAILAGALIIPLFYALRFFVAGRSHDATEFQEAQAALGLSYSGHSLDWFFLIAWIAMALVWLLKSRTRPRIHLLWNCLKGAVLGLLLLAGLQTTNNMIFDPIFEYKQRNSGQGLPGNHEPSHPQLRVSSEAASGF
jgi:hypothetical protein